MQRLSIDTSILSFTATAHAAGLKKVLFSGADCQSNITQFAFGKLAEGEIIPAHSHPTMEEFFYFLTGEGQYEIDGEAITIKPGTVVRIPAGSCHTLSAETTLEFVYFGIGI